MASKLKETKDSGRQIVESVVIRFAGDSGDGMQLTGNQFTQSTALMGNDLSTFPDFPAEIRAPVGTTYGVSAFQINLRRAAPSSSTPVPLPTATFTRRATRRTRLKTARSTAIG
jgi:hypothetical protein